MRLCFLPLMQLDLLPEYTLPVDGGNAMGFNQNYVFKIVEDDAMKKTNYFCAITLVLFLVSSSVVSGSTEEKGKTGESANPVPSFIVDPFWPKPLPNDWLIGQVAGVAVDSKDHVWIIHRPNSLGADEYAPTEQPSHWRSLFTCPTSNRV